MKHYWSYCEQCGYAVVVCRTCRNNTCTGGYGRLADGTECPDCKSAYKKQDNEWYDQDPKFKHVPRIRAWRNF